MTTFAHQPHPVPPPKRFPWLWVLGGTGLLLIFSCGGCIGLLAWVGSKGPDPWVQTGNQIAQEHVQEMKDVGALDDDEEIFYFYSDAIVNITKGFSFVSDRKVVVYSSEAAPALTTVPFAEITDAELFRDDSFFIDSEIMLELANGRPVSFPVSSTNDGDLRFFEAIESRLTPKDG